MTNALTFNIKGGEEEKTTLPKEVFEVKANPTLLAQTVRIILGNQRKGGAKTKTRSEVAKTTAKMYKQKGTGRARHGSYSAPIFVGGGGSLGPTEWQNFRRRQSADMSRKAMLEALSIRAQEKKIVVVTEGGKATGMTKEARKLRDKMGELAGNPLVVVTTQQKELAREWRNLRGVKVVERDRLNVYEVLARKNIIITREVIDELKNYANN